MPNEAYILRQNISKAALWKAVKPRLSHLDIELTERCNNNCVHCYINLPSDDINHKKKELSVGEIKGVLRQAVSLGCLDIRFSGGEPLLREGFEELYVFSRKVGLKVSIFTNATLVTPRLAELFNRIPPLKEIEITVYGMKRSSYEAVTRVSGSFEAFQRGINLLLKKKIPFVVKGALLPSNIDELEEFESWAATIPWMDNPPTYSTLLDLRCRRDDLGKNAMIKRFRFSPQAELKILTRRREEYVKMMKEFCSKFISPPANKLFSCGAGCGGCVDSYGNFQPCMGLRHPDCVYNLKKGTLKDALDNFFPKIKKIKALNSDYLAYCAKCFLKGLCEQCPAKSWMEHGTLDKPVEYLCQVAHAQARFLGLLTQDEKGWEIRDWKERVVNFTEMNKWEGTYGNEN